MSARHGIAALALFGLAGLAGLAGCELVIGGDEPHIVGPPDAALPDAGPPSLLVVLEGTALGALHVTSDDGTIDCPGACDTGKLSAEKSFTLTATTGGGGAFLGWRGVAGCDADATCTVRVSEPTQLRALAFRDVRLAFVSSTLSRAGLLGGRGGADGECQRLALAADLPHAADFVAWLAGADGAAALPEGSSWLRVDGEVFAESAVQLLRAAEVRSPLRLDEHGVDVGPDALVLTDLMATGQPLAGSTRCGEYAGGTTGRLGVGLAGGGSRLWTQAGSIGCGDPARLYCFDAHADGATTATVPARMSADRTIFVSTRLFAPGGGLPGADAICRDEAMGHFDGDFVALLAGDGMSAVERAGVTGQGRWLRPDNVVVFASRAELEAGTLRAAVDLTPLRAFVGVESNPEVWLGAPSLTEPPSASCESWGTNEASKSGARTHASSSAGRATGETGCDQAKRLYCVQK